MDQIHIHAHATEYDQSQTLQEAVITRAYNDPDLLTLTLSSRHGTVLAVYTDKETIQRILADLDTMHASELIGKRVVAHFSARKLVGISAR